MTTQLWTRLASTSVQQQQQQTANKPGTFLSANCIEFSLQSCSLANLQQLKNLKVDYQDGIAVVQFNQENSKVPNYYNTFSLFCYA